jgi:D-sedoheptulose 7-phosphate isomerase
MRTHIQASLVEARNAVDQLLRNETALGTIEAAANLLVTAFDRGGRAFSCGNGGSMCDAMHFAEELTGRFRKNRPGMAAIAISDATHITCVANDYGYDQIFARYLESHARSGDVLLAISTSGKSPSVLTAAETAKDRGLHVIGLTGRKNSPLQALCDIQICTEAGEFADRVQELHIKVIHILIELIERQKFPSNFI